MENQFAVDLISNGGLTKEPSINQILNEIQMVIMDQVKIAYYMLSDDWGQSEAESLLFVTLAHWERISRELAQCNRKHRRTLAECLGETTESQKTET
jgi:hypothetical protein